jgi:hypothetical protein
VIVDGHAFAYIVKEERENQQIAAVDGFPELAEVSGAFIGRLGKFLEMFDGAERVFVNGVAVIKVADDERIDGFELGEYFHQERETLHGS